MFAEFTAAASALKAATDITQALLTLKTDAAVSAKVVQLNGVIADVQQQLFKAQADYATTQSRLKELKAEIEQFKNWEQEKQRYQLHQLAEGTVVYRVKPDMQGDEPVHELCPNCYQNGVKSILQKYGIQNGHHSVTCPNPNCRAVFLCEKQARQVPMPPPPSTNNYW
ncbi:hypothetical protein [Chromobacterium sphagni]|uniref:hypothetical protein n=1 Tax=Chromobacterium sphagni TaxID=1903179 RepID=UPI0009F20F43|nr:hypothetical protein [Chromobacterium sphagni]